MNQRSISKIELLIVGLIVGVLGIMAVIAVSSARSAARDAIRLSDIRQVQAGVELYFNDTNEYPHSDDYIPLGSSATTCLSNEGFLSTCLSSNTVYLQAIGATPQQGLGEDVACFGVANAYCYTARKSEYRIEFELENNNPLLELVAGTNCAMESGLEPGPCPALSSLESEE